MSQFVRGFRKLFVREQHVEHQEAIATYQIFTRRFGGRNILSPSFTPNAL